MFSVKYFKNDFPKGDRTEKQCKFKQHHTYLSMFLKIFIFDNEDLKFKFYQSYIRVFPDQNKALIGLEFRKNVNFADIKQYILLSNQYFDEIVSIVEEEIFNVNHFIMSIRYFLNLEQVYLAFFEIGFEIYLSIRRLNNNKTSLLLEKNESPYDNLMYVSEYFAKE